MSLAVLAEEKVVLPNNEYGGATEIFTYSEEDAEHEQGFHKKLVSYDKKKNIKAIEVYATEAHTRAQGWYRSITYYWGKTRIGEVYPTDSHSEKFGFDKMVIYLDKDLHVGKREYFLRENTIGAKQGIYKRVIYYDRDGRRVKARNLDKLGNVVRSDLEGD
jgi:hypothetical protein